jgi:hypothetical protein
MLHIQTYINSRTKPLLPQLNAFEVQMANEKLKRHKSPGIDQIPAELIKGEGKTIHSVIHKHINPICNKENCLRSGRSRSLYLFIRVIKTYCSDNGGKSLLSTKYRLLSNILLSTSTPYAQEIIEDYQCGLQHNRSTTDHIFRICQILEKKCEYNEAFHQLFLDFMKNF